MDKTEIEKWTKDEESLFGFYELFTAEWDNADEDQLRAWRRQLDQCSYCVCKYIVHGTELIVVAEAEEHYKHIERLLKTIEIRQAGMAIILDECLDHLHNHVGTGRVYDE